VGTNPYREPDTPRARPCPRCASALQDVTVDKRAILQCDGCRGFWLPPAVFLDALIEPGLQADLQAIDRVRRSVEDGKARLSCPVCRAPMTSGEYGRSSGVILDACKPHGVWLDPSEITRIVRFANANAPRDPRQIPQPSDDLQRQLHQALFEDDLTHSPFWRAFWSLLG